MAVEKKYFYQEVRLMLIFKASRRKRKLYGYEMIETLRERSENDF